MKNRFTALCGRKLPVTFGTFHAVYFSILKYAYNYKYFEEFIGGFRQSAFDTEEEAKKEFVRRKEIIDKLRVRLHSKEELEEFKQYVKDNDFEDYDEAYLYWKGYLK